MERPVLRAFLQNKSTFEGFRLENSKNVVEFSFRARKVVFSKEADNDKEVSHCGHFDEKSAVAVYIAGANNSKRFLGRHIDRLS